MEVQNTLERKNYDILDLVKLILSLFIVATHLGVLMPFLTPVYRLAVPLFFLISSYFFFKKINSSDNSKDGTKVLKNFVLRNVKLYLFWLIVLSPIIVFQRLSWFSAGILTGLINVIINVFVGSTFTGSWFITALIIGTVIVFLSSKKLSNKSLFIISLIICVLVALRSSYFFLFDGISGAVRVSQIYEAFLNVPFNSFPVSLFFIVCGKIFAEGKVKLTLKASVIALCLSFILLIIEWLAVYLLSTQGSNDCYIMLIPTSFFIFNILISVETKEFKYAKIMRKSSIIVFASHGAVAFCVNVLFKLLGIGSNSIVTFVITLALCALVCVFIFLLEKYKYFKWLKYSH